MTIRHNSKTGKTSITLSWIETKQLISTNLVHPIIQSQVGELVRGSYSTQKSIAKNVEVNAGTIGCPGMPT
jgi:hypothetical protein